MTDYVYGRAFSSVGAKDFLIFQVRGEDEEALYVDEFAGIEIDMKTGQPLAEFPGEIGDRFRTALWRDSIKYAVEKDDGTGYPAEVQGSMHSFFLSWQDVQRYLEQDRLRIERNRQVEQELQRQKEQDRADRVEWKKHHPDSTMDLSEFNVRKTQRWHYVFAEDGDHLNSVGVTPEGEILNPEGYDLDEVERGIRRALRALKARYARGAAKRKERREAQINRTAKLYADAAGFTQSSSCYCCSKVLSDGLSIARGVGPECWEQLLKRVERLNPESAKKLRRDCESLIARRDGEPDPFS